MSIAVALTRIAADFRPMPAKMLGLKSQPNGRALALLVAHWQQRFEDTLIDLHWPLRSLDALVVLEERLREKLPVAQARGTLLEWLVGVDTCDADEGGRLSKRVVNLLPLCSDLLTAAVFTLIDGTLEGQSATLPAWLADGLRLRRWPTANRSPALQLFCLIWPKIDALSLIERAFEQRVPARELLRSEFALLLPNPWVERVEAKLPGLVSVVTDVESTGRLIQALLEPMLQRAPVDGWRHLSTFLEAIPESRLDEKHWYALLQWIEARHEQRERLSLAALSVLRRWKGLAGYRDFNAILDVWREKGDHVDWLTNQLRMRSGFWSHYQSHVRGARLCLSKEIRDILELHNDRYRHDPTMQVSLISDNIIFDSRVTDPYAILVFEQLAVRIPFSGSDGLVAIKGVGLECLLELTFPELIEAISHLVSEGTVCLYEDTNLLTRAWTQDNYVLWQPALTYRLVNEGLEPDKGVVRFDELSESFSRYTRGKGLPCPSAEVILDQLLAKRPWVTDDHPAVARALREGKLHPSQTQAARNRGRHR